MIDLYLENYSDSSVKFSPDFGTKTNIQKEKTWEEVDNTFGYPTQDIILPTAKEYPPGQVMSVKPDLTELTVRPLILRITVKGKLSDSDEDVGAYLAVMIE